MSGLRGHLPTNPKGLRYAAMATPPDQLLECLPAVVANLCRMIEEQQRRIEALEKVAVVHIESQRTGGAVKRPHYFDAPFAPPTDRELRTAKMQGYVPKGCLLAGETVWAEVSAGRSPCWGCNGPRDRCGGKPRRETDFRAGLEAAAQACEGMTKPKPGQPYRTLDAIDYADAIRAIDTPTVSDTPAVPKCDCVRPEIHGHRLVCPHGRSY